MSVIGVLLTLSLLAVAVSVPGLADVVTFPDPEFEAAIRSTIEKPTGEILDSDLIGLSSLLAIQRGIVNLEGIQYCVDLETLKLYKNKIVDISPLTGLIKLSELWLYDNDIVDISPLSGLANLTTLWLTHNQIRDISPLTGLIKLSELWLSSNYQIRDISPLSGLTKLTLLDLGFNQISDISPLSRLTNLTRLRLDFNQIRDISPLSGLTNLVLLSLGSNQIRDIRALLDLTELARLDLEENDVVDITPLVNNTGIDSRDYVFLSRNQLLLAPGSSDMLNIETLRGRFVGVVYEEQNPIKIGLVGHTLPGVLGDADGGWSVGLDWWLGDIPDEGGLPDENSGLNWDQLNGYGFSLYRDDLLFDGELFRVQFTSSGGPVSVTLWKHGESEPIVELDFDEYKTWYGEGEGERATFCGLFDKWTEFEDYDVSQKDEYTYRVALWYGSPDNEISSSDPIEVTAGKFAWGVVARDTNTATDEAPEGDLGDPLLREQYTAIWSLADNGLEYCKFWMDGKRIEWGPDDYDWGRISPLSVNWMGNGVPLAADFENAVDAYAFSEAWSENLRWDDAPDRGPGYDDSFDSFIERLNSKGVSPVPWFGHGNSAPEHWPAVNTLDADTMNEYLTRLYVHARAAARRYRYGLHKIPLWNLENELNWTYLWRSVPPYNERQWMDHDFVTNVYRALSLAIEHENWRDVRWDKPVTYARRTTNFNIHCHEAGIPGLLWTALTLNLNIASLIESNLWLTQSLEEFIQDWEGFFDIIGLGAYPNYLAPEPKGDILLWNAVERAITAAPNKPVMVLEAGYPKGLPLSPQGYEYLGWQQSSIEGLASSAYRNGADGFFYFTLFSDCPLVPPLTEVLAPIKWVEHYWGLLEESQASEASEPEPWSPAFDTYLGIIANPDVLPSDPPSPLVDVEAGVVALQNGIVEIIDGISKEIGTSITVVDFLDPNLELAIRVAIGKPTGEIRGTDLIGLVHLAARGRSITNLEGIQHCINLTELELGWNYIGDISPLSGLTNLTKIHLRSNYIVDIQALVDNAGLSAGDYVDIQNNFLDFTPGSPDMLNIENLQHRGIGVDY
ncbi:leucine-rich repeat domain-containing protein [Candidatus Bipolaricaulota bacterium]